MAHYQHHYIMNTYMISKILNPKKVFTDQEKFVYTHLPKDINTINSIGIIKIKFARQLCTNRHSPSSKPFVTHPKFLERYSDPPPSINKTRHSSVWYYNTLKHSYGWIFPEWHRTNFKQWKDECKKKVTISGYITWATVRFSKQVKINGQLL